MSNTNEAGGLYERAAGDHPTAAKRQKLLHDPLTIHGAKSMTRFPRTLLLALLFGAVPAHAVGLPDTGQDTCYNDTEADTVAPSDNASIARDGGSHPRQDCRYGRDAAAAATVLAKSGGGVKGFDYAKIANNGTVLAADATRGTGATNWACTKDNITGLIWEVKTDTITDLRSNDHTYTWYNSNDSTNGGNAGSAFSDHCNGTLAVNQCNTQAFVAAVNAAGLCSYTDWRLPSRRELLTLVYANRSVPAVDPTYFPNPPAAPFWSASSYVPDSSSAWFVDFADGYSNATDKLHFNSVRLVRGAPF